MSFDQPPLFGDPPPPKPPDHDCPMCAGTGRITDTELRRLIEDRPGAVSNAHPSTSRTSAYTPSNVLRFGTQRFRCLTALREAGPSTAAKVAVLVGLSRNQTATRLGELRMDGFVAYCRDEHGGYVTEPTSQQVSRADEGIVQTITSAGAAALRAVRR